MTKEGKEKLTVGVITALITGVLAVVVALLTKPSVTNIVLPGGETVNADEIVALQSENAVLKSENVALRANLAVQANAAPKTTDETTTKISSSIDNTEVLKVTLKLKNGKRYPATVSKNPDTVPLTLIEGSGDTYFIFEIEGAVIFSIVAKCIQGKNYGKQWDLTDNYRRGTFNDLYFPLDHIELIAFNTDQGIFYIKAGASNIF